MRRRYRIAGVRVHSAVHRGKGERARRRRGRLDVVWLEVLAVAAPGGVEHGKEMRVLCAVGVEMTDRQRGREAESQRDRQRDRETERQRESRAHLRGRSRSDRR